MKIMNKVNYLIIVVRVKLVTTCKVLRTEQADTMCSLSVNYYLLLVKLTHKCIKCHFKFATRYAMFILFVAMFLVF